MTLEQLRKLVRTIPDFPAPGIEFRDVTPLIAHPEGLVATIGHLAERARAVRADAIAGIEARGFIFGGALAAELGLGFVPLRKPGKLPMPTIGIDYALEYGEARIELDPSAIGTGERVILVDDLIATGGSALAGVELLRRAGAQVPQALFVIDLPDLGGMDALRAAGVDASALFDFAGQ